MLNNEGKLVFIDRNNKTVTAVRPNQNLDTLYIYQNGNTLVGTTTMAKLDRSRFRQVSYAEYYKIS